MELFLIRHAIALPAGPSLPDAARPLSPEGRERFTQVVRGLQHLGIQIARVHHSPWLRAVETAELLHPVLDGESLLSPALAGPPEKALLNEITSVPTALVGHEPWMGELLAWLTTGSRTARTAFDFRRGGVAWLEGRPQPGRMTLRAFLPPKVLRALAQVAAP